MIAAKHQIKGNDVSSTRSDATSTTRHAAATAALVGSSRRHAYRRRVIILALALAGALTAAGCASNAGHDTTRTATGIQPPGNDVGTRLDGAMASNITRLPLVESDGTTTNLAAFRGKVLVISDTMTLCQETCPLDTANLVQTAREIDAKDGAKNIEFLSITVDPTRDTPAQLAAYRSLYQPTPSNWLTLTGTSQNIATLWKYLGVYVEKVKEDNPPSHNWRTGQVLTYDIDHSDEVFFFDPKGNERFVLEGAADVQPGTTLPKTMRAYLDSDGVNNLDHPQQGSWTVPQALQTIAWLRSLDKS